MKPFVNACDVFVYPSAWESFGIAYLEAWAAGKPVIGCRRGAVPWVINSGEDGLLVDYGDNDNLAGAILLLVENREWADNLGRTGQIKTMKRYTWKTIARQFRGVYELALEDNQRRNRK